MVSKLKNFVFESIPTGIRASRKGDQEVKNKNSYIDDMEKSFPTEFMRCRMVRFQTYDFVIWINGVERMARAQKH